MKRAEGTGIKARELTDEIREVAKQFIPERKREEGRTCQRKPGGGRKPPPSRQVSAGIFFVLRTGIQRKAPPKEYGSASGVRECFSTRAQAGLFMRLWREGLLSCDEPRGIGWDRQSADGCTVKAPLARETAGKNPAGPGKKKGRNAALSSGHTDYRQV